jgi:hypothetical protein
MADTNAVRREVARLWNPISCHFGCKSPVDFYDAGE